MSKYIRCAHCSGNGCSSKICCKEKGGGVVVQSYEKRENGDNILMGIQSSDLVVCCVCGGKGAVKVDE